MVLKKKKSSQWNAQSESQKEGKAKRLSLLPAKLELLIVTTRQDLDSSSAKIQELGFRV